jgi:hypothetical protein
MGEVKIALSQGIHDCATVLALHGDYAIPESSIAAVHGLRVQKIGEISGLITGCRRCSLAAVGSLISGAQTCKLCR